jgi:quercetin dioxygenase-like cupin family protein
LLAKAAVRDGRSHGSAPDVPNSATLDKLGFMLKHTAWKDVELEQLNPLLDRQMITGEKIMLARVLLKKGCVVPEHSHENEQVTYILEGALKFWIDGKEIVVHEGEVLCIPSNMPHKAEAVVDTVDLDVFYPPRQDWLNKTDSYLRGKK